MNKVFLSGYVVSGPELKLETGKPVQAIFQMNAWHRAEDEQWKREAYTVCCLAKRARWAMDYIRAGQRLAVEGTLLGAEKVKIAAHEIAYIDGIRRARGPETDAKCEAGQEASDDTKENEGEETMAAEAQTETRTQGTAQSNDGIDPQQRKWYPMGKKNGRTEASRAASAQGENAAPDGKDRNNDGRFSRMKKKLLSMMLALVMALGVAVCANADMIHRDQAERDAAQARRDMSDEERASLFTLWGIPWGCTIEEAERIARENAGVILVPTVENNLHWLDKGRQDIYIMGCPVQILTIVAPYNSVNAIQIMLNQKEYPSYMSGKDSVQDVLDVLKALYGGLYEKLGHYEIAEMGAGKAGGERKIDWYHMPEKGGKIDFDICMDAASNNDWIVFDMYWNNVDLSISILPRDEERELVAMLDIDSKRNDSRRAYTLKRMEQGMPQYKDGPSVNTGF